MQYYISLHSTFRRPKLQEHYEIQKSKFVMVQLRLEEVIVVMDQGVYAKLHRLYGSTHTANVMGISISLWTIRLKWETVPRCWHARHMHCTRNHCRGYNGRRIIWKNVQSISTILERWREYSQKLMDEYNLRERKKWTASRSGGWHYRDHKWTKFSERWIVEKLPWTWQITTGRSGYEFEKN